MKEIDEQSLRIRAGVAVSEHSTLAAKPATRVRSSAEQCFPDSGVADSERAESRGSYNRAIKIPAVKSS